MELPTSCAPPCTSAVIAVKAIKHESREAERAGAEGKGYGFTSDLAGCVENGVQRVGACDSPAPICSLRTHAFLWGCMDAAGYDRDYCARVAVVDDDEAVRRWTVATCAAHGQPDNEACRFSLSVVSSFCSFHANQG